VPHQERVLALLVFGQEELHVHLLDHVLSVRIELGHGAAGLALDHAHLLARHFGDAAADMKRTHAAQHDVFREGGRDRQRSDGHRRADNNAIHDRLRAFNAIQSPRPLLRSHFWISSAT
jgi:hypothetical protein